MIWQDFVFTFGAFILGGLLLPTILDDESTIPQTTSLPTATIIWIFAFTFLSLGLYLSAIAHMFTGTMWFGIALLKASSDSGSERDI